MAPVLSGILQASAALLRLLSIPPGFTDEQVNQIRTNLLSSASYSWELGTAAEALTELEWPALSVFNASGFPLPSQLPADYNASDVLNIAATVVSTKTPGSLALVANDGAVGDPASIGVSVLLANWTRTDGSDTSYSTAAEEQLDYLLNVAPRSDTGAISQRTDEVQLWADFIYMAPPFIAYFGVIQGNTSLLQIAYDQIRLYRDVLRDDDGLWRHVALGSWQDDTHWATGCAWAAAGMLRVLMTIVHSSGSSSFSSQTADLTSWIQEITTAAWSYQTANGTLLNVIDDSTSFADSSSTALMAAVTYRMTAFTNDTTQLDYANKALSLTENSLDADGWLTNTVDPYTFTTQGTHSPEGQAFLLLLDSARRDFIAYVQSNYTS